MSAAARLKTAAPRAACAVLAGYMLWTAATVVRSSAVVDALTQLAVAWAERARRVPTLTASTPSRRSLARGGGRVAVIQGSLHVTHRYALGTSSPVVRIVHRRGQVLAATFDEGLFRLADTFEPWPVAVDPRINDVAVAPSGELYVATGGGAYRIGADDSVARLATGAFTASAWWKGQAYFASPRGLSAVEGDSLWTRNAAQGVPADQPSTLADCDAVLCIGAVDGLWLFDGERATRHSSASSDLPADWVTAAAQSEGILWAGTMDGGLARRDADGWRRFAPEDGVRDGRIQLHGLLAMPGGTALFATPSGLFALDPDSLIRFATPELGEPTALAPAAGGGLWVGGRGSVTRITLEEPAR